MDLVICTDYDPRFSRVDSRIVRFPAPMPALVGGDVDRVNLYLIDEDGNYLHSTGHQTFSVGLALYSAAGVTLANAFDGSTATIPNGWAITLDLSSATLTSALSGGSITASFHVHYDTPSGASYHAAVLPVRVLSIPG